MYIKTKITIICRQQYGVVNILAQVFDNIIERLVKTYEGKNDANKFYCRI